MRTAQWDRGDKAAAMLSTNDLEPLMSDHDVARIIRMSLATVRRWRRFNQGPKYFKIGAAVRYRREDVEAYLNSRQTGGEGYEKPDGEKSWSPVVEFTSKEARERFQAAALVAVDSYRGASK